MRILLCLALLVTLASLQAKEPDGAFCEQAISHFAAWDQNHDEVLSLAELDQAIASSENKGEAAAALVALKRGSKTASKPLTAAFIRTGKSFAKPYEEAMTRIRKASRTLYATQPPQIDSIRQGKTGDCFCLAALRTVLQRDPAAIVRMIQPAGNGVHSVQIGDKSITVPPITDGEIAIGASTTNGLWPLVYEKAIGIYRMKPGAKDATPYNVATKGGSAGAMMSTLVGKPIKRWSCKTWRDEKDETKKAALLDDLRQQLASAFSEKRLVTGGTAALAKGKTGPPGITFNHGYAVLGYDAVKDELHLWNPHGDAFKPKGEPGLINGYPRTKGEFRAPLKELVTFFGGFAFEQRS